MKLEKIFIRNFRSVGEKGLELTFTPTCTTFIGENNVGKSSIFEAIKKSLEPNIVWDVEEWHSGNQSKTVEIQLVCKLDDNQIKQIIGFLGLPLKVTDFIENFTNELVYEFRRDSNQTTYFFKLGELNLENGTGWIGETDRTRGYSTISKNEIIRNIGHKNQPIQVMKEMLSGRTDMRIDFHHNVPEDILKLLRNNIIVIEEFRGKPLKTLNDLWTSPRGQELASVLFNLKNARPEQRKKFEQIQEKFQQLFPTLELDVIRETVTNEIKILIQKSGIESTTFYLGAGILESLLLITHLIAHSDKVLCIDHPELHLHPHAQRRLGAFIDGPNESQIMNITHSPYFVNLSRRSRILRFIQKEAQTEVIEPPQNYFTDEDFFKLEQFLDVDTEELFFARKAVLVEGPTELGALPIFASNIYNFDENGVSIIFVGGKKSFDIFVKLCEGFKIPYLVIADNDAEKELIKLKKKYPNCKSHTFPDEFDTLLPERLRKEAESVLGTESKPRIGRYVAKKLIERREIPEEISHIIEEVQNL